MFYGLDIAENLADSPLYKTAMERVKSAPRGWTLPARRKMGMGGEILKRLHDRFRGEQRG